MPAVTGYNLIYTSIPFYLKACHLGVSHSEFGPGLLHLQMTSGQAQEEAGVPFTYWCISMGRCLLRFSPWWLVWILIGFCEDVHRPTWTLDVLSHAVWGLNFGMFCEYPLLIPIVPAMAFGHFIVPCFFSKVATVNFTKYSCIFVYNKIYLP